MIVELIGRLHPLLVHMPIGVMVLYVLFGYLQILGKMDISNRIMNIILFIGILTGIASIISGYTLSIHDSYDASKLDIHKWTAIGTISLLLAYGYFNIKYEINKKIRIILLAMVLILIIVTGHLGGTLSYGENYFNFLSQDEKQNKSIIQYNISDIENANVFEDLIMVSLKQKCIECHGPTKQKGELRLDSRDWILKGGKHGQIINFSDPASSEMLKRIFIDLNEEQHMPPKRKTQLEDDEINLIEWWINAGSPFNTKVSEVGKTNLIDSILHAYHNKMTSQKKVTKSERPSIKPIPEETIRSLVETGWVISVLSRNDNHVRITGFNIEKNIDSCIDQLLKIKEYIVELKL